MTEVPSSCDTMGVAGTLDACRLWVGDIRDALLISSIYLNAAETFITAGQVVRRRLCLMSSLTQRSSLWGAKHVQDIRWALCWASPLCQHENKENDPCGRYAAVRRSHWCTARHGHSMWTNLLSIVALLLLSRQLTNRKEGEEYAAPVSRSYLPVYHFARADYGLTYTAADASGPRSRNDSDLQHTEPPPARACGSRSLSHSPIEIEKRKIPEGHGSQNHTSRARASSVLAARKNAGVGANQYKRVRTSTQERVSNVNVSSRRKEQAAIETNSHTTGRSFEWPSDNPESITSEVRASGGVNFRCSTQAKPAAIAEDSHIFGEKEPLQELASPRRLLDVTAQQVLRDGERQRSKQHGNLVRQKQLKAVGDVQQQRRTKASLDMHDGILLQHHETPSTPANGRQMQEGRGGIEQDLGERRPQEKREDVGGPVGERLSRSLQDGRRDLHTGSHQRHGSVKMNDSNDSHESRTESDITASQTHSPPQSESVHESSFPYFENEKLSQELKAAQNALMADVTAHLSRLWRKHWLQAIEAALEQRYEARLEALPIIVEQMEVAVSSVVLSRPRDVSMGLGRWLHKMREVFIFVFSTRLGLGVASADLRPVGPLAATAHDIPEESADVVEVVTGASQRVLLLAPASREENARCYANTAQNAWQQIQASLFPAGMEAQLVETRASLAKLFDLLGTNVAALAEDHNTSTSERMEALTNDGTDVDTCSDNGSCRYRALTSSSRTNIDGRTDSIKDESVSAQRRGSAYTSSLYHGVGSDYKENSPYSTNTVSSLPSNSGQVRGMETESGVRLAGSPGLFVSEKGEHAAVRRRASKSRSEEELYKSLGIQLPITTATASTNIKIEAKPLPSLKDAHRVSTTSDIREGGGVYDNLFSLDYEAPTTQKSTKDIEEGGKKNGLHSSNTSKTRTIVNLGSGDIPAQSRITERKSNGIHTHNSVNDVEVNESEVADGISNSSEDPGTRNTTDTSKKSSVSGIYETSSEAEMPVPSLTNVRTGIYSAADDQMTAEGISTPSAALSLEKQSSEDTHAPGGTQSAVSSEIRTNSVLDDVQSRGSNREASATKAETAEDGTTSEHKDEGVMECRKSRSSDALVDKPQESDATLKNRPVLDSGNAPSHLRSDSVKHPSSHLNRDNLSRSGSEGVDTTTTDEAGGTYVKTNEDSDSKAKTTFSRSSTGSDGSKTLDGSKNAAERRNENFVQSTSTKRNVESHFLTATSRSSKLEEKDAASSRRGSRERRSSNVHGDAAASGIIATLDSSSYLSSKSRGDTVTTGKRSDFITDSRVTASGATGSEHYSKAPTAAESEGGGTNCSTNNESRGVGCSDTTADDRSDHSEYQSSFLQTNNRSVSGSGHGVERSSGRVNAKGRDVDQSSTAAILGAGSPQETDRSSGKTSLGDGFITHSGHPLTKDTAGNSGDTSSSSSSTRGTYSTGTREATESSGISRQIIQDGKESASGDLRMTGANATGDRSLSGKQRSQDVESNAGVTEPGSSGLADNRMKNTNCNSTKTDRGVDVVYCITEESDEGNKYGRDSDSIVNSNAFRARNDSSESPSNDVSADTSSGALTLKKQISVSDEMQGEAQNHLQNEKQQHLNSVRMFTSLLPPEHAESVHGRDPVSTNQQGGDSQQPSKRNTMHTSRERGADGKTSQSSLPEKKQVGAVSSEPWQTQEEGIRKTSVPDRTTLQQQVAPDTALQHVHLDKLKKKQESKRPRQQPPPEPVKRQGRDSAQPRPPQHSPEKVGRDSISDQQNKKGEKNQESALKTVGRDSGSSRGDDAFVPQQVPVARDHPRVMDRQPSETSSEGKVAEPAKDLRKEIQRQQQHKPSLSQSRLHKTSEGKVGPFLALQQKKRKSQSPLQTSSEEQQQLAEKQEVQGLLEDKPFKEATTQQELHSPRLSSLFQKETSSEENKRHLDKSTVLQNNMQPQSLGSPSCAGSHPQAADHHAAKALETEPATENSKQGFKMYKEPKSPPAPLRFPTGTTESEHADSSLKVVMPKEEKGERKTKNRQAATAGDSNSERPPAAGPTLEREVLEQHKVMLGPSSISPSPRESDARDTLRIESAHETPVGATDMRIDGRKSPPASRTGMKGNVEPKETCQQYADHSVQPKPGVQQSAPLLKLRKKDAAQHHREIHKRIKHPEHEQLEPSKLQQPLRRFQPVRNREVQHHANLREKVEHLHPQQKEVQQRSERRQAAQQPSQRLQVMHLPSVVPHHVMEPKQVQQALPKSLQASPPPRCEGKQQADVRVRRVRRWHRLPGQQQQLRGRV